MLSPHQPNEKKTVYGLSSSMLNKIEPIDPFSQTAVMQFQLSTSQT